MDLLVSGAGPAGVATAIGMARHGHAVTLLAGEPTRPRLEGLSPRTREALERDGCPEAAALAGAAPVGRFVAWGAMRAEVNREFLVDRARFDEALRADARSAGVEVVEDRLVHAERDGGRWIVGERRGRVRRVDYWIEARGRAAPRGRAAQRGVPTLAVALPCSLSVGPPIASALVAVRRGFFWAVARDDRALLQWFRDPPDAGGRGFQDALHREMDEALGQVRCTPAAGDDAAAWLAALPAPERGPLHCRDATPYRVRDPIGTGWLRVGDAAAASDPLSGQGVWSALAMARAAVACARTQLERPRDGAHADRFYRERVAAIHGRDQRKGRDFYADETRWRDTPFWSRRSAGVPDPPPVEPAVETRPVLRDGLVETRRVLVTAAHPEGVWHVDGVPVVALLEAEAASTEPLATRFGVEPAAIDRARAWLHGVAPSLARDLPVARGPRQKAREEIDVATPDPAP